MNRILMWNPTAMNHIRARDFMGYNWRRHEQNQPKTATTIYNKSTVVDKMKNVSMVRASSTVGSSPSLSLVLSGASDTCGTIDISVICACPGG